MKEKVTCERPSSEKDVERMKETGGRVISEVVGSINFEANIRAAKSIVRLSI